MKPVLAFALLLAMGCNSTDKNTVASSMPGAYRMLSQSFKSESLDTTMTSINQLKIFTGDFVMYANVNSTDSSTSWGFGSYEVVKDTVMENMIISATDSIKDDTVRHYNLTIEKTDKGYKQIIPEIGSNKITLIEEYERSGSATKTSLDGSWSLVNSFTIKGTDTTADNRIQYKTFYNGHCIWGMVWTDSLNKNHAAIGFGTFELGGTTKLKEKMIESTFADVKGHDFDIDLEMTGTDEFTQTHNNADGSKSVEYYRRMKK